MKTKVTLKRSVEKWGTMKEAIKKEAKKVREEKEKAKSKD